MTRKADPAAALHSLIGRYLDDRLSYLRVGFPCRVIAFDAAAGTADIQPLIRISDADPAMIHSAPVLFQRYSVNGGEPVTYKPFLQQGDVVFAICADRELKNAKAGKVASADTERQHSVNDAVIVGVFGWNL
ncbi:hypothetical protein D3C81_1524580 [compost metagenome]